MIKLWRCAHVHCFCDQFTILHSELAATRRNKMGSSRLALVLVGLLLLSAACRGDDDDREKRWVSVGSGGAARAASSTSSASSPLVGVACICQFECMSS